MGRVIVIGLDGATWDLLRPWIDKGELPSIGKLVNQGVWANLKSTYPFFTGPAWTSFSTGRNPGKHGIFDFVSVKNGKFHLYNSSDIKCTPFYEILSNHNIPSIIIGLPLSFPPPSSFKGIMISDFLFPVKSIRPRTKEKYLENYEIISNFLKGEETSLDEMIKISLKQIQTAKELFTNENWEFFFFLYSETDQICHGYWNNIFEMNSLGEKAKKIFKIADNFIGWIINEMRETDLIFIISDHGFGTYKCAIQVNNILRERGLVKTKLEVISNIITLKSHLQKIMGIKRKFKLSFLSKFFVKILNNPLIKNIFSIKKLRLLNKLLKKFELPFYKEIIDFKNSYAYVPTKEAMGIYINKKKEIKSDLINIFRNLKYNGKNAFKRVLTREETYSGPYISLAPDILLIPDECYPASGLTKELFTQFFPASHKLKGIFIAYGSEIKKGLKMNSFNIYDIAPTILHTFALPIPSDMDGEVLKIIYEEDSERVKSSIKFYNEFDKIKKKVKDLTKLKKI